MTARIQRIGKILVGLAAVTRRAAGVLALGLLFSGAAPAQTTLQLLQPVKGTPVAKDFALPDLDGRTVRLKDLRGKVVLVNFWATWCPPCRFEIPAMQRAWLKLKEQGVVMLAVHLGGAADEVWSFAEGYRVTFPILMDKGASVGRSWGMRGLPTRPARAPGLPGHRGPGMGRSGHPPGHSRSPEVIPREGVNARKK